MNNQTDDQPTPVPPPCSEPFGTLEGELGALEREHECSGEDCRVCDFLTAMASIVPGPEEITDAERLDTLAHLLTQCPHADIGYNDDPDCEDPVGWRIRVDGCESSLLVAPTFREVLDLEVGRLRVWRAQNAEVSHGANVNKPMQTQETSEQPKPAVGSTDWLACACCGEKLAFQWADYHGVGVCVVCGLPHEIIHYENNQRVEGLPTVAVKPEWVEVGKRYWQETQSRVFPAAFDMGFFGERGRTYSGATEGDIAKWQAWLEAHDSELPKQANSLLNEPGSDNDRSKDL